ncbi:hypothetical protein BGM09_06520 [Streptomyces sp. CBMA29]|nr:hypothetical protein [Streptomyces sp. CBMA29]
MTVEREPLTEGGEVRGSTAVRVGQLRKIARAKLALWGLSALVEDAQLLISELVTNGFRYGTQREVGLRLVICLELLVLEVDDGSPERPQLRESSLDALNGRGLLLVSALAESWGVSEDGKRTWCLLRVPAPRQAHR